jgi:hypothetical protein
MPRRIRNPGSGKAPVNTPGKGEGWGGAAKGAGRGGPAKAFTKDSPTRVTVQAVAGQTGSGAQMGDPEKAARRRELAALEEVRQQQMRDVIGTLALNAEREETQLSAAVAYLNRSEGLPVATQKNENRDMTLEKMVAQAAKLRERRPD